MIPADAVTPPDADGRMWWVMGSHQAANCDKVANRPCDTCGGGAITQKGERMDAMIELPSVEGPQYAKCPDCNGTGRHVFDIEVEGEWEPRMTEDRTLSVSVVAVLPIADNDWTAETAVESPHNQPLSVHIDNPWVTLPSAAKPGLWAVRLAVLPS